MVPKIAFAELVHEAVPGGSVTYDFTATTPGMRSSYGGTYSGTQGDLQMEMGLYGAIVVLPAHIPDVQHRTCRGESE